MACPFSESLGKPGEGVHAHFLGVAMVDVVFTIALAYILHRATGKFGFGAWLAISFAAGIVAHRYFCVRTTVDRILFP